MVTNTDFRNWPTEAAMQEMSEDLTILAEEQGAGAITLQSVQISMQQQMSMTLASVEK